MQATVESFARAVDALTSCPSPEAQRAVMEFRSLAGALEVARGVVSSASPTFGSAHRFHASQLMMQVVLERWEAYAGENPSWHSDIFMEALKYAAMPVNSNSRLVVVKLLACATVFWKRGWKKSGGSSTAYAPEFDVLVPIESTLPAPPLIIQALLNLVQEFAASTSSAMGLPHAFHRACHRAFESSYLLKCFEYALITLRRHPGVDTSIGCLSLCDACLSWTFMNGKENEGYVEVGLPTAAARDRIRPGIAWRDDHGRRRIAIAFLFDFYRSHRRSAINSSEANRMQHLARQILLKLACVNGEIFGAQDSDRAAYAAMFSEFAVTVLRDPLAPLSDTASVINSFEADGLIAAAGDEINDMCILLIRLASTFRYPAMLMMPAEILDGVLQEVVRLANNMLECAVVLAGNDAGYEDAWVLDAFQHLLDFWVLTHSMCENGNGPLALRVREVRGFLAANAASFYEHTVLKRIQMAVRSIDVHDATCNGFEEMFEDEEAFEAQMDSIAFVGRIDPAKCLSALSAMMANAFAKLSAGEASPQLSETVYWLACFAGHLLADKLEPDPIDEKPPESISFACRAFGGKPQSWPSFASAQSDIPQIPDPAVKLIAWLVTILRVEAAKVESTRGLDERVSPLVSEKLFWAISRVVGSYMFCRDAGVWIAQAMDSRMSAALVNAACVYLLTGERRKTSSKRQIYFFWRYPLGHPKTT